MPKVKTKNASNADQLLVSDYFSPVSPLRFPPSPPPSSPPPSQSSKARNGARFRKVSSKLIPKPPDSPGKDYDLQDAMRLGDNRVKLHDIRKRVDQQDQRRLNTIPAKSAFPRGVENLWPVHDMRPQFLGPRVSGERRELDESEKRVTGSEGNLGNYGEEKNDDDHIAAIDEAMLVYDSDHELFYPPKRTRHADSVLSTPSPTQAFKSRPQWMPKNVQSKGVVAESLCTIPAAKRGTTSKTKRALTPVASASTSRKQPKKPNTTMTNRKTNIPPANKDPIAREDAFMTTTTDTSPIIGLALSGLPKMPTRVECRYTVHFD